MVLYGITLPPLAEELKDSDKTLLSIFYTNDVEFDGLARRSAVQLRPLMEQGMYQGYLPETAKSLFISENTEDKEAARQEFERSGLNINYVDVS